MSAWRPIVAVIAIGLATLGAVYLLTHTPPYRAAAVALLIGAILISLVLVGNLPDWTRAKIPASADSYKSLIASVTSLGGGAAVVFALIWILIKVTSQSITPPLPLVSDTISLPLIVIVGVTILLIVIALVTFTFSVLGLSSGRDALGLPDGSVRAIIALMLLVLFSIMSILLYNSIEFRQTNKLEHIRTYLKIPG